MSSEEAQIITEHYVDKLTKEIQNIITDDGITTENISSIMLSLMVIVDQYPNLTGIQKKQIILAVLKKYVLDNFNNDSEECIDLLHVIETVLPNTINLMISIDKGEVAIRLRKNSMMTCLCSWKNQNKKGQS